MLLNYGTVDPTSEDMFARVSPLDMAQGSAYNLILTWGVFSDSNNEDKTSVRGAKATDS